MPLVKDGALVEDTWRVAQTPEEIEGEGPLFVTLELWQAERERLAGRNTPLGLRLKSSQSPEPLAGDLKHFAAVALEFPKFSDGRAYSYARILREHLGFTGELRAVGNVLRDQLLFMQRCGFDVLELREGDDPAVWQQAIAEFSVWYQPTADARQPAWALRRRRKAGEAA